MKIEFRIEKALLDVAPFLGGIEDSPTVKKDMIN